MVPRQRSAGDERIDELAAAVREPAGVTARRAVAERHDDLRDVEPGAQDIDRHAQLAAEPGCERKGGAACPRRQEALAGERLAQPTAGAGPDHGPCDGLRDPEPASLP